MRILIAPDKFKGTLSAREVCDAIAAGLRDVSPAVKIDIVPMADGGEGTAEVIGQALDASWIKCKAHDPLGREIEARYAWVDARKVAVMEMSEAAGMRRLKPTELNPEVATTFGVGEMLLDAAKRGAREIIIGLGGSATNDGGFGMACSLGFHFLKKGPHKLESKMHSSVFEIASIEKPANLKLPQIVAAVDVKNPLLGENGATRVFGPQKGATPEQLDKLEAALTNLANVVAGQFGFDYRNEPGAGAAGGLGFGLMSFCGAKIRPGFQVVGEAVGLEAKMKDVDVVITGEGSLDRQTLEGKTPAGVGRLARKLGKRVFAFVGRATQDRQVREMFDGVYQNERAGMSTEENMKRAAELLQDNARQLAKNLK
ncbi:MAG: glycerate kinase [Verrucomicrobia bacterium]|nr:glycerate kinase [Verrucomicrobiota bacterium]